MAVVGKLTLQTSMDSSKLEKQLVKLKNRLSREEIDLKVKTDKADALKKERTNMVAEYAKMVTDRRKYNAQYKQLQTELEPYKQKYTSGTISTPELMTYDKLKGQLEEIRKKHNSIRNEAIKQKEEIAKIDEKIKIAQSSQDKQKIKVSETTKEVEKLNQELGKAPNVELPQANLGFEKIIKKITKIGLGLIGLRTGMALLRNSVSTVSNQNDEIANKISAIKSAIANALTPAVQVVVNLFAKLMAYIGYILRSWFGIDIFAKNTANNTKKMKNNFGAANKEATKLKRTLAGFDEMNILNKDGGVSTGGGGGGVSTDDFDMTPLQSVPIPEWVQWIADNKDGILTTLTAIAGAIGAIWAAIKVISIIKNLISIKDLLGPIFTHLSNMGGLKIFGMLGGIAIAIGGLVDLVISICDGTITLSSALKDLGIIIDGVAIAMIAFNATNPVGWIALVVGAVMALAGALGEEKNQTLDLTEAKKELYDAELKYVNSQKKYVQAQKDKEKATKDLTAIEKKYKMSGEELYKQVLLNKTTYDKLTPKQKEVYLAYMNMLGAEASVKQATDELKESEHDQILSMLKVQAANAKTEEDYRNLGKTMSEFIDSGKIKASELEEIIEKKYNSIDEYSKALFVKNIPKSITSTSKEVKKLLDYVDKLKKKFDDLHKGTQVGGTRFYVSGYGSYYKKGGIVGYKKGGVVDLPKLAPGGLINRPGPGVAIGGEAGTEGVIPLTDSQQMARLGRAIGRYINIRAEIPVNIGNRQVAREIRNINAEESFAFNG